MQHVPEYIAKFLQDPALKDDDMKRSHRILEIIPEKETDIDYVYTLSTSTIRHSAPHQLVIDKCEKYLPLITTPECREFMQSIRIWKYEALEQFDKAIALRLEQAQEHSSRGFYYQELAKAYKKIEDNVNAIKYYEHYMMLEEYNVDTDDFVELAELYDEVKDFKKCAEYHGRAAAYEARFSADHWQKTGRALALDGQIDEAMFYFKVSLKIDPKDAFSHYYMGHAYQNKKDKYRALHHYTEALKIDPDFVAVHLNIGAMEFYEEGDVKTAIACFENAIEKDTEGKFLLVLYRNLRNLYKQILDFDKSEYYRGKIFELAGFPADMGEYLDSLDKDGLEPDDEDE